MFGKKVLKRMNAYVFMMVVIIATALPGIVSGAAVADNDYFGRWHQSPFGTAWYQYDSHSDLIEAKDGGFVSVGEVFPWENHAYGKHANIIKYAKNGAIEWSKTFGCGQNGNGSNANFAGVVQLSDGGYLAVGSTNDKVGIPDEGYASVFAVRFDANGDVKWQKVFGAAGSETHLWASGAYENKDGTLTILGCKQSKYNYTDYGYPIFVELQLGSTGDLLNDYLITDDTSKSVSNGSRISIKRTADSGYIAVGDYAVSDLGWTAVVTKLDPNGRVEWGHYVCPTDTSQNKKVKVADLKVLEMPDGFVAAGNAYINAVQKLFIYKVDLQGNLLWNKLISGITLSNEVHFDNLYLTKDNNILVSVMNGYSTVDYTLVNLSNSGNVNWVKSYGSKLGFDRGYGGSVYLHRLVHTTDNTIVGVTANFITKLAKDGGVAFTDDRFMMQERSGWKLEDGNAEKIQAGYWYKYTPSSEFSIIGKDVTYLVPGSAKDTEAVTASTGETKASIEVKEKIADYDWSGTWSTNWGSMVLVQSGNTVTGTYTHDNGKISGTVSGDKLTGTWSEASSYSPPRDAGDIIFTLSSDGKTFSGSWRYGSSGGWSGGWNGSR